VGVWGLAIEPGFELVGHGKRPKAHQTFFWLLALL